MPLGVWTKILLADTFGAGSGMKSASGNMFFTRGGTDGDADLTSMSRMIMIPEPAALLDVVCLLLGLRRPPAPGDFTAATICSRRTNYRRHSGT